VTIQGSGKDAGGKGQAAATIDVALVPVSPALTRVRVRTDLGISGRLAQFGGGTIVDIASRVIQQFTANLNAQLAAEQVPVDPPQATAGVAATPQALPQASAPVAQPPTAGAEPLDVGAMVADRAMASVRRHAVVAILFFAAGFAAARLF
jgi:hypothetical protein